MRKILLLLLCGSFLNGYAGHVLLSHYGDIFDIVPVPTYEYATTSSEREVVSIEDSLLCSFLDSIVSTALPADTCTCENVIWHDMIHIVYIKDNCKYYTINLTHYDTSYHYRNGCLEIDGQIMQYNKNFQIVMDNIVNYIINYDPPTDELTEVIHSVIRGKRFNLHSFLFPPLR